MPTVSRFSRVNLNPLRQAVGASVNRLYRSEADQLKKDAKRQVAAAAVANPEGFLPGVSNNGTIFNETLATQIRTENVVRGSALIKIGEMQALSGIGNTEDMNDTNVPDSEALDFQLKSFDDFYQKKIRNVIPDNEAAALLDTEYTKTRAGLIIKVAAAKEKMRRLDTVQSAEKYLNIALHEGAYNNVNMALQAARSAMTANPAKASQYQNQFLSFLSNTQKKENINDDVSEQMGILATKNPKADYVGKGIFAIVDQRVDALQKLMTENPSMFPPGYLKEYTDKMRKSIYSNFVDKFLLPGIQQRAQAAMIKEGGGDLITRMKTEARQVVGEYGKQLEAATNGRITATEFDSETQAQINIAVSHYAAQAKAYESATKRGAQSDLNNKKTILQNFAQQVKDGPVFGREGGYTMWIDKGTVDNAMNIINDGTLAVNDDTKNVLALQELVPDNKQKADIERIVAGVYDDDPAKTPFQKATAAAFLAFPDEESRRKALPGLELVFEGLGKANTKNPQEEELRRRAIATGTEFAFQKYAPLPNHDTKPPADSGLDQTSYIIQSENEALDALDTQIQQRSSLSLRTDGEGYLSDTEKRDLYTTLARMYEIDKGDSSKTQSRIRGILADGGDAAMGLLENASDLQNSWRIPPTADHNTATEKYLDRFPNLPSPVREHIRSVLPFMLANHSGRGQQTENNPQGNLIGLDIAANNIVKNQLLIPGTNTLAPSVNWQLDFFGSGAGTVLSATGQTFSLDESYQIFDDRHSGVTRRETNINYLVAMLEEQGKVIADPVGDGEAIKVLGNNEDYYDGLSAIQDGTATLQSLPNDKHGNARFVILNNATNSIVGNESGRFIITLPLNSEPDTERGFIRRGLDATGRIIRGDRETQ